MILCWFSKSESFANRGNNTHDGKELFKAWLVRETEVRHVFMGTRGERWWAWKDRLTPVDKGPCVLGWSVVSTPSTWVVSEGAFVSSGCCKKCHELVGLNNKHLFLTVLRLKSKIRVPAQLGFFVRALSLVLASHGLSLVCALGAEREREISSLFLFL